MLIQRMDNQYKWEAPQSPEPPSVAAKRMWYDTVGHGWSPALTAAIAAFGSDRLVLGTDFPYQAGAALRRGVAYLGDVSLSQDDVQAILERAGTLAGLIPSSVGR